MNIVEPVAPIITHTLSRQGSMTQGGASFVHAKRCRSPSDAGMRLAYDYIERWPVP